MNINIIQVILQQSDIVKLHRLHCIVHFSMTDTEDGKRGHSQWFYKIGIYEKTAQLPNKWDVSTFNDLRAKFGHTEVNGKVLCIQD